MNAKTKSEELFEAFCCFNGIICNKIPTASGEGLQTPDYEIILDGHKVIVEVKQFNPNDEELILIENLRTKGRTGIHGDQPGKRVRKQITDAMPQLHELAKEKYPAIIVLFDNIPLLSFNKPTAPYNIKTGMYGLECVDIGFHDDHEKIPEITDRRFGGKRKVGPDCNTTLSAILTLEKDDADIRAICYHNRFTALPLNPNWMRFNNVVHYTLEEKQGLNFQEWVKI